MDGNNDEYVMGSYQTSLRLGCWKLRWCLQGKSFYIFECGRTFSHGWPSTLIIYFKLCQKVLIRRDRSPVVSSIITLLCVIVFWPVLVPLICLYSLFYFAQRIIQECCGRPTNNQVNTAQPQPDNQQTLPSVVHPSTPWFCGLLISIQFLSIIKLWTTQKMSRASK